MRPIRVLVDIHRAVTLVSSTTKVSYVKFFEETVGKGEKEEERFPGDRTRGFVKIPHLIRFRSSTIGGAPSFRSGLSSERNLTCHKFVGLGRLNWERTCEWIGKSECLTLFHVDRSLDRTNKRKSSIVPTKSQKSHGSKIKFLSSTT